MIYSRGAMENAGYIRLLCRTQKMLFWFVFAHPTPKKSTTRVYISCDRFFFIFFRFAKLPATPLVVLLFFRTRLSPIFPPCFITVSTTKIRQLCTIPSSLQLRLFYVMLNQLEIWQMFVKLFEKTPKTTTKFCLELQR